jgi:hypothetical protein
MTRHYATWESRSLLSKRAHIIERSGLATAGGSCALFVAAQVCRTDIDLLGAGAILIVMLCGALGFYLGIDLPPPPEHHPQLPLLRTHYSRTDGVELLSAFGTFLASITAFISVWIIVLDEAVPRNLAFSIAGCWAIGAAMQITAGILARARKPTSEL